MQVLLAVIFIIPALTAFAYGDSYSTSDSSRHEREKELIRKEAEYNKQLDRETYPDLPRDERKDRDREIEKAAKELF